MSRPEDPSSRPTAPKSARQKQAARVGQKRAAKPPAPRSASSFDSDFGVAMLVCCSDEAQNDS